MNLSDSQRELFLKCSEEMLELSLELLFAVNKPRKKNKKRILDEIKDVEKQINLIKEELINEWIKRIMGSIMDRRVTVNIDVDGIIYLQGLDRQQV